MGKVLTKRFELCDQLRKRLGSITRKININKKDIFTKFPLRRS
ncbi:hypothetical protein WH5701_16525 [Synechococcus sp. WH 5701]|nr:hypothetical protein WH5701_16525 [Synechococcus sp. WH 5701]